MDWQKAKRGHFACKLENLGKAKKGGGGV